MYLDPNSLHGRVISQHPPTVDFKWVTQKAKNRVGMFAKYPKNQIMEIS